MAVIWHRRHHGKCYQVRTAGHSIRLYTDNVFHSQYNWNNPIVGSIWELLVLPAFLFDEQRIQRVLVLGVGGGSAIKLLKRYFTPSEIVGVELNDMHLYIAKRFFKLNQKGVDLVQADAQLWVNQYRGAPFDLIIDDLYIENQGEPCRAVKADAKWCASLFRHLSKKGMVISNFISKQELKASAYVAHETTRHRYQCGFQFTDPCNENAIGVFVRDKVTSHELRTRLKHIPELDYRRSQCRLRFRVRSL